MKLFLKYVTNASEDCEHFLNEVPKLIYEDARICKRDLNDLELLKALKSIQNNTSTGHHEFTKEFYETFWNEIKNHFMNSIIETR